jgi:hypothetical protein
MTAETVHLYHARQHARGGSLDKRDEEECFTEGGRRVGIWLTTEVLRGELVVAADVELGAVVDFEVTSQGAAPRVFVVPADVVADYVFSAP